MRYDSARELMSKRILFVDDEPDLELLIRQRYRKQLRREEVELAFASNGVEALRVIEESSEDFDIIITDINMPVMTGLELLGELLKRRYASPIVVLSAYGDMANIRTAMNRGAFDFLTKPIDFSDLNITQDKALAHVESVRERSRLEHEKNELQERATFIRETFGRYLSESVVQTLLDEPQGLQLGGEKRQISILMSDLRGFTAICERLAPEAVVSMLNSYFGVMIDIILAHGGTIDELLGDAVLVLFGAPLGRTDHADQAVRCAIAMQRAMEAVNEDNTERGLPHLEMGIAINTGEAVVGNIGSRRRAKYGVVGSQVNLTARIEGLTVGQQVLISNQTFEACSLELETGSALTFVVKGYEEPVEVHELRGVVGDPTLRIPRVEPRLRALRESVEVRFSTSMTTVSRPKFQHRGHIVRASLHHCELVSADTGAVEPLSTLGLCFVDETEPSTIYGKVVGKPSPDTMLVRFTSLPPAAAERLERLSLAQVDLEDTTMLSAHQARTVEVMPAPAAPERIESAPAPGEPEPALDPASERRDPLQIQNHLATLGLMMAGVAHDIRNPLGFIISFADMSAELSEEISTDLGDRVDPEIAEDIGDSLSVIRDNLGKIKAHGHRASGLIQSMLDTARGARTPPERIGINPVIARHLDLFEASMRSTGAAPELRIERVLGDDVGEAHIAEQDVSRILLNLVQNACDAALARDPAREGPPSVTIETRGRADAVEIRVRDNGTGVSDSVGQTIFEPLFTTKGTRDGLGLGLALVRELIDAAGGTIAFETQEHEFTEFMVTLPRDHASGSSSG